MTSKADPAYQLQLIPVAGGYDGETCWVHARAGAIPAADAGEPTVVMTMQKLLLSGSDIFYALHSLSSFDRGRTWAEPDEQENFRRVHIADQVEKIVCDFSPRWHTPSDTLLGIGHTAYYNANRIMEPRPRQIVYAIYDPIEGHWEDWHVLQMPDEEKYFCAGAGCVQRLDLPNGDVFLPVSFLIEEKPRRYATTVVRCNFDGRKLEYAGQGNEFTVDDPRGLYEASLVECRGRYFLTLRNDLCGYVAVSFDGLRYEDPEPWTFDDGEELGNYNTQQHWVKHGGDLYLVYTRRGLGNDHVFRHRAPLLMARVDLQERCVLRDTEVVIVPERGARLGNFGVVEVAPDETWVTVAEWMQPAGCEAGGSDNTIWVARLLWQD